MKRLLIFLIIAVFSAVVFATFFIPYNNAKPPSLALLLAYNKALDALGTEANRFHCVGAEIDTAFSKEGGWQFTFYSTNAVPKWVTVEFNGKIHIENKMLR